MTKARRDAPYPHEPMIGALLREAWDGVRARMMAGLAEAGFDDLHPSHFAVLQWPGPGGARPSELAERLRMSKQAVNHLLGQLERTGYLRRRPHPDDPRARIIELTDRGAAAAETGRRIVEGVEAEWSRALGARRFAELRSLLLELRG